MDVPRLLASGACDLNSTPACVQCRQPVHPVNGSMLLRNSLQQQLGVWQEFCNLDVRISFMNTINTNTLMLKP